MLSRALFFVDFGVLQHNSICVRVVRTRSLFSDKFAGNYKSMFLLGQLITLAFLELEEQPLLAAFSSIRNQAVFVSFTGSRIYADYVITLDRPVRSRTGARPGDRRTGSTARPSGHRP